MWSTRCNVIAAIRNMWLAQKPSFGKYSMCTSRTFEPMHVNTMRSTLTGVRRHHMRVSLCISMYFAVSIKIIEGASDVYSLRRKELFWQYKLGTFALNALNERAADIELDMLEC